MRCKKVNGGAVMAEVKGNICVNSIESAKKFLDNQDKRKAPNNRVNGYHFLDIANKGAERLKEKMIKKQTEEKGFL